MVTSVRDKWMLQGVTFLVWAGAAACVVFWGLKMSASAGGGLVAPVELAGPAVVDVASVARLLGAVPGPASAGPAVASRFTLLGVMAGRQNGGAALIAVDGKPARPVRVGSALEEGLVLQTIQGRQAVLGPERDGPATVTLEMAPLK